MLWWSHVTYPNCYLCNQQTQFIHSLSTVETKHVENDQIYTSPISEPFSTPDQERSRSGSLSKGRRTVASSSAGEESTHNAWVSTCFWSFINFFSFIPKVLTIMLGSTRRGILGVARRKTSPFETGLESWTILTAKPSVSYAKKNCWTWIWYHSLIILLPRFCAVGFEFSCDVWYSWTNFSVYATQ